LRFQPDISAAAQCRAIAASRRQAVRVQLGIIRLSSVIISWRQNAKPTCCHSLLWVQVEKQLISINTILLYKSQKLEVTIIPSFEMLPDLHTDRF
jgi:hypothetical protein